MNSMLSKKEDSEILHWLTQFDYGPQHSDYCRRRHPGTGTWFLESTAYRNWRNAASQTLFCSGIPGAGKTILTSVVVEDLAALCSTDNSIGLAYIYCSFRHMHEQRVENLLASVLKQLARRQSPLLESVISLYKQKRIEQGRPSPDELSTCIEQAMKAFTRTFLVIDSLDKCETWDRFLSSVFDLQKKCHLKIFATARPISDIAKRFTGASLEIRTPDTDIRRYLEDCISLTNKAVLLEIREEIAKAITEAVNGRFVIPFVIY